jgi:hypothetical protein
LTAPAHHDGPLGTPRRDHISRRTLLQRRPALRSRPKPNRGVYTALDAYVSHFAVVIPRDAVAHIDAELGAAACKMMERNMDAELTVAAECLG